MIKSSAPMQHWIIAHIPVFTTGAAEPIHGNLVVRVRSLWLNPFFDPRPWAAVALAVTFVSVLCWLPLIRALTHSIGQLTRATGQIAEGRFEVQLPKRRHDELGQLSESINRMAQRLSGFVHGQKRFLGDIAHELCSPIARIQVALGILEQRAGENEIDYVVDLKAEVEHMSALVNELLSFSKAQVKTAIDLAPVDVGEILRRVVQREASDAVEIKLDVGDRINVIGQPEYIFRSFANVIRNAIRYSGDAGPITISAMNRDGVVAVIVADNGPGVPESELDEIFKPFYRPELARTRATGGTGLGLAIVKDCIEACGGTVTCRNLSPRGFEVEMRLAAADSLSITQ
jgi:two-component system sensor histidine kinase CpxA